MRQISACYTSGRGAHHFLGIGRCTISRSPFHVDPYIYGVMRPDIKAHDDELVLEIVACRTIQLVGPIERRYYTINNNLSESISTAVDNKKTLRWSIH